MTDVEQPVSPLTVGVPRERAEGERRVSLVPDAVTELIKLGISVVVESGAGLEASFDDEEYARAGARVESVPVTLLGQADILVKVQPPTTEEITSMRTGALLVSFLDRSRDDEIISRLAERGVTAFSFESVPRIARAQSMDAMSSMSTVAGYKAVLLAAGASGRFFPLLMTAAGTMTPSRVVVIGAGVAGLQALATARRLGAITAACDARPAVHEQIQSVGATYIDMSVTHDDAEDAGGYAREMDEEMYRQERDAIRDDIAQADVVISTALIPGARAPLLIDREMVCSMRRGSVIVDLAAEAGGNCELSIVGETTVFRGVTLMAPLNLPSTMPVHASQMYARNVLSVLKHVVKDGALRMDIEDEIIRSACITELPPVRA